MAFCRFGAESAVYVFESDEGRFICCRCALRESGDTATPDQAGMIAHLLRHREAGHLVPDAALDDLRAEAAAATDRAAHTES